jgi:hypothetical protein
MIAQDEAMNRGAQEKRDVLVCPSGSGSAIQTPEVRKGALGAFPLIRPGSDLKEPPQSVVDRL